MSCPPLDDETSIREVSGRLVVGAVRVTSCPGFGFQYFAREMGDHLHRMKVFFGEAVFPVIGYVVTPNLDAAGVSYSTFVDNIRTEYLYWRVGNERDAVAWHLKARNILLHLKTVCSGVVHYRHSWRITISNMYRRLYVGGIVPSPSRIDNMATFVLYLPANALSMLSCTDGDKVLTHRVLTQPWKKAAFPDAVCCKLISGLGLQHMDDNYFIRLFEAYRAAHPPDGVASSATMAQRAAISNFERELSGRAAPFNDRVATGNPCTALDLFCECVYAVVDEDNEPDGTMGDRWETLSNELKGHYAAVASTVAQGQNIDDLKAQVHERGQAHLHVQAQLQQQLQGMQLTEQVRAQAHDQAKARAEAQPALIEAALTAILSGNVEATVSRVMGHMIPVSPDMFTGDRFGSDACQAMLAHLKDGESPVVAPGTLLGWLVAVHPACLLVPFSSLLPPPPYILGAIANFGDCATWVADNHFAGKMQATTSPGWETSLKDTDWLDAALRDHIRADFLMTGTSLMMETVKDGKEGLACRSQFLDKLSALPGFREFLQMFDPLTGSEVYANSWEDLTFTLFRSRVGESSGFHLDTVTISTAKTGQRGEEAVGSGSDDSEEKDEDDEEGVSEIGAAGEVPCMFIRWQALLM